MLVPFTVLEEVMLLSEVGKIRLHLPFRDLVVSLAQTDNFDLGVNDTQVLLEAAALTGMRDPLRSHDRRPDKSRRPTAYYW